MTKSIFLQRMSATVQFILGFAIGISLIAGVSGGLLFAYYKRMSVLPQKPDFPTISSSESTSNNAESSTSIEPLESNTALEDTEELEVVPVEPEPEIEELEAEPEPEIPSDAYYAKVTWPQGLSIRAEPDANAGRVGGVGFDETILILGNSADGTWQRIRVPWSEQEGWVKAGNVERTSY